MKTIAFTGKRPQNLPWRFNEQDERCIQLKEMLGTKIESFIKDGYTAFISGMALGIDVIAAEIVLDLKRKYPQITLEAALPCENQADKWRSADRERYFDLLPLCDEVAYVSQKYTDDCMMKRNRYMVDKADLIIAVYDNSGGGTGVTIKYAKEKGKPVIQIRPI